MRRRRLIPKILFACFLWAGLILFVFLLPPDRLYYIAALLILIFISSAYTLSLILRNQKYAVILSISLTIFLLLRMLRLANILNLTLLLALTVTLTLFFHPGQIKKRGANFPQG